MVTNYWKCISVVLVFLIPAIASDNRELREIKYDNGQIKERFYVKLDAQGTYVRDGLCTKWYPSGKKESEATFNDGKPEGIVTVWYTNGKKKNEATFKNRKLEGITTTWFENGNKQTEGTNKNGELDGIATTWYESGKKESEVTFKDGKQEGVTTSWYENGNKKTEVIFRDGKLEGITTEWYENGNKKAEGTCKDGKLEGIATEWYENGKKKNQATLKNGKVISYADSVKQVAQKLSKRGIFKLYKLCGPDTVVTILDTLNKYVFTGNNNFQKYLIGIGDHLGIKDKDYILLSAILKSDKCSKVLKYNLANKYLVLFDYTNDINNSRKIYFLYNNAILSNSDIDKVDAICTKNDNQSGECKISLKRDSKVKLYNYTKDQIGHFFATSIDSAVYACEMLSKPINSIQIKQLTPTVSIDLKQLLNSAIIDEKY